MKCPDEIELKMELDKAELALASAQWAYDAAHKRKLELEKAEKEKPLRVSATLAGFDVLLPVGGVVKAAPVRLRDMATLEKMWPVQIALSWGTLTWNGARYVLHHEIRADIRMEEGTLPATIAGAVVQLDGWIEVLTKCRNQMEAALAAVSK